MLLALQRRQVGSPWAVKDTLWPQQGDCFRQEGNCQSLECLVQTLDLVLTGVWRGESRQEEKQCFQSVTGLSSSSKAPSVVGGAGGRGAIWENQSSWMCGWSPTGGPTAGLVLHVPGCAVSLKPEEMTELPPSLPGPLGSLCGLFLSSDRPPRLWKSLFLISPSYGHVHCCPCSQDLQTFPAQAQISSSHAY